MLQLPNFKKRSVSELIMCHHRKITFFKSELHVLSVHHTCHLIIKGISLAYGQFLHPSLYYLLLASIFEHFSLSDKTAVWPAGCSHARYLSSASTPAPADPYRTKNTRMRVYTMPVGQIITHRESGTVWRLSLTASFLRTARFRAADGSPNTSLYWRNRQVWQLEHCVVVCSAVKPQWRQWRHHHYIGGGSPDERLSPKIIGPKFPSCCRNRWKHSLIKNFLFKFIELYTFIEVNKTVQL